MIVKPKVRGFICTTAHPIGCKKNVQRQIEVVEQKGAFEGPQRVLVIGASTGFGLASRISAAFGCGASTIGISFEKLATEKKTATPGWYNTIAFEEESLKRGLYATSINGDAFSDEVKMETIKRIKEELGKVDLVIYSIASPRRTDPKTGDQYYSALKPIGRPYKNKTIDITSGEISEISIEPATKEEIFHTVKVMGGEDWALWIEALSQGDVLEEGALTIAYSYIGSEITLPIYRDGTIGKAKESLEQTATLLNEKYKGKGLKAFISVNKALVTQASSAIPVVPLYISILYKIMKAKGLHEGCIEQMDRMFREKLYSGRKERDSLGRIRLDDWEMRDDVQCEVKKAWETISEENRAELLDLEGYKEEFYQLFGFGVEGIDYEEDVKI